MNLHNLKISGGRIADFIVTADGKWVVGYSFIYIARSVPGIVKFQAQQERQGEVTVLLATDDRFPADGAQRVAEAARARLGGNNKVEVKIVADISPAASGKYRPVVSTVGDQLRRQGRFEPEKMA
jgi:phenylacetate-CoA ligase